MLCLAFAVSGFNFISQKCAKAETIFEMLSMSDFGFTQFCMLCLAFPKTSFNLVTVKCPKKLKTTFSNTQNIRF